MNQSVSAPCEACPPCCKSCAWSPVSAGSALDSRRRLAVVRTEEQYGCVRPQTSIVIDRDDQQPFMRVGDELHPLSPAFGDVIKGTKLERDIEATLALS